MKKHYCVVLVITVWKYGKVAMFDNLYNVWRQQDYPSLCLFFKKNNSLVWTLYNNQNDRKDFLKKMFK